MNNGWHCESPGAALEMLLLRMEPSLKDLKSSHYIAHSPNMTDEALEILCTIALTHDSAASGLFGGFVIIKGGASTFFSTAKA
jgi:hypothetical protein